MKNFNDCACGEPIFLIGPFTKDGLEVYKTYPHNVEAAGYFRQLINMKNNKITDVQIYMRSIKNKNVIKMDYCMEYTINEHSQTISGGRNKIRDHLKYLKKRYRFKCSEVKWKRFLVDSNYLYRWNVKKT